MKLQQILSTVFPRISRSKSEKSGSQCERQNRPRSKSDRRGKTVGHCAPGPSSACRSVPPEPRKDIADKSEEATPTLIQTFCYENSDDVFDCSEEMTPIVGLINSSFNYYYCDGEKTDFKEGFDGVAGMRQFGGDNENSPIFDFDATTVISTSKLRRKIRTNPWLQTRQYFDSSFDVLLPPGTGTADHSRSSGSTPEDVGFPGSISDRLLLMPVMIDDDSLLQRPPGWAMDSGSEGYATSLVRSPSSTDLECASVDDSALASSVSSESDLYWIDRSPSGEFDLHRKRSESSSTGLQHPSGELSGDTEGDAEKIFDSRSQPRNADETANSNEELILSRGSSLLKLTCDYVHASEKNNNNNNNNETTLRSPSTQPSLTSSDVRFELRLANTSGSSQKVAAPSGEEEEEVLKEDPAGHVPSTDANFAERSIEINPRTGNQDCELKPVDDDDNDDDKLATTTTTTTTTTTRSLVEVSRSLQEKVETLHEQKHYVDAVFMRARQLDRQREAELARFRVQLAAKKKQTMLQRLQELKQTLASQSIRIQSTYDTILWKQWPISILRPSS